MRQLRIPESKKDESNAISNYILSVRTQCVYLCNETSLLRRRQNEISDYIYVTVSSRVSNNRDQGESGKVL